MGQNTVDVTDETFKTDVLGSEKTVVVDFWATWCGPCKMVAPVLDEIAGENKEKLTVAKLDIDANPATARDYGVMSIPTMIVFQDDVLSSDKTVLVDFWAEWCGPCKMVAPVLDEIAGEHRDKLTVAKLDIDRNPGAARDYQVMSIPTMIVFQGGKPVKQIVGAKPKAALLRDLADYLG
jgi:thioredoxin 1